ncbi:MAG: hypothetical protein Kow00105_11150 [Phycisphaeraceae bacterium]
MSDFKRAFCELTGHDGPYPWQIALGRESTCRNRIIKIPTGLGKTEGIMAAWIWHRFICDNGDSAWPTRLVWCLPMRVLVEQTVAVVQALADKLPEYIRPGVYPVMGGVDSGDWFWKPEQPAVLVGTQDMLLSRALNRGYASGRARWPVEYGLLHHDALWVMDEIQLMDVGLATSAQLQTYRDQDQAKGLRPCYTWWMSATLQADWLKTVDTKDRYVVWTQEPVTIAPKDRIDGLWTINKSLETATIGISPSDTKSFTQRILDEHANTDATYQGRVTLVVCNTVKRACETYAALVKAASKEGTEVELVHSRFRPHERQKWRERFLNRVACEDQNTNRIIVATQVVEAGVDISAGCLITELAPWPSLVQRFGRCARYEGCGRVVVVDRRPAEGKNEKQREKLALPYTTDELNSAWDALQGLTDKGVGIASLEEYEQSLDEESRQKLYPYDPPHLLLRKEFDELFDTTPDLTGADLDISRFIRSGDERDLHVFWRDLANGRSPGVKEQPHRDELCPVPFLEAQKWLCAEKGSKTRSGMRAWVWDWLDGEWKIVTREALLPGRIVCVAAECGGYSIKQGFTPDSREKVEPVLGKTSVIAEDVAAEVLADTAHDIDALSAVYGWKTIAYHGREVATEIKDIASSVGLPDKLIKLMELAANWHDVGKAHPAFQGAIRHNDRPHRQDLAKAPSPAWLKPPGTYRTADDRDSRPGFRHELASALALFAVLELYQPDHPALLGPWPEVFESIGTSWSMEPTSQPGEPTDLERAVLDLTAEEFNLLAYLVAAHHGKVRVSLHASPKDQDYEDRDGRGLPIRGVREGDTIPPICLDENGSTLPEITLTLEPAKLGLSPRTGASWRERTLELLDRFGPTALAYLEALLRAADFRASRLNTSDPALQPEALA